MLRDKVPVIPATWEGDVGRTQVQGNLGQTGQDPVSKFLKRAGDTAQW